MNSHKGIRFERSCTSTSTKSASKPLIEATPLDQDRENERWALWGAIYYILDSQQPVYDR